MGEIRATHRGVGPVRRTVTAATVTAVLLLGGGVGAPLAHAGPVPNQAGFECILGPTPDGGYGAAIVLEATTPASEGIGYACWFQVPAGHGTVLDYEASTLNRWRVYTTGSASPYPPDPSNETTIASSDSGSLPVGHVNVSLAPGDFVVVSMDAVSGGGVCATPVDSCLTAGTVGAHV